MEEERGISIGEIFKVIFKRIWWAVGALAACMIIFVLFVQFYYNPHSRTYSLNFTIDYPDFSSGLYPDGTYFRLSDLVELETLNEIKASNDDFDSIDVETMCDNDDITIETEYDDETSTITTVSYTITVHVNYFTDKKQATQFLKELTSWPVTYAKSTAESVDYALYLNSYEYAQTFEQRISLLNQEYSYITSMYNKFINKYGSGFSVKGKTLSNYITDLQTVYETDRTSKLTTELEVGAYLYDLDKVEEENTLLESQREQLQKRLDEAIKQFNELYGNTGNTGSFAGTGLDSNIASFTDQIAVINNTLEARNNTEEYIANNAKFSEKLDEYKSKLESQAEILRQVSTTLYSTQSKTVYSTSQITREGGLNIIIAAVAGAVVGFIVAGVVICIIDMPKYLKERDAELAAKAEEKKPEDKAE